MTTSFTPTRQQVYPSHVIKLLSLTSLSRFLNPADYTEHTLPPHTHTHPPTNTLSVSPNSNPMPITLLPPPSCPQGNEEDFLE